jgi:hypothetical protein
MTTTVIPDVLQGTMANSILIQVVDWLPPPSATFVGWIQEGPTQYCVHAEARDQLVRLLEEQHDCQLLNAEQEAILVAGTLTQKPVRGP